MTSATGLQQCKRWHLALLSEARFSPEALREPHGRADRASSIEYWLKKRKALT
jgi:hypothetical protein